MSNWNFESINELNVALMKAYADAKKEAEAYNNYVSYRGTVIATSREKEPCRPLEEADAALWDKTWQSLVDLVKRVEESFPEVTEIYLSGGFDGAESRKDYRDSNYDPWVSWWSVEVWKRK